MRIVVNDIAASCGGAITILKQFYNYIKTNDIDNEWIFLLSDKYIEETDRIKVECFPDVKNSRIKKVLFDCFIGKEVIDRYLPDVVVSLQNIITFGIKQPQILYIHQSIPFQKVKKFSFFKRDERSIAVVQYIIGAFIKASAKRADKVFVQTKWMQKAVSESVGIPDNRILTAFPGVEHFSPNYVKYDNKRFFYPTNSQKYKNIEIIVKACNKLNNQGINDFIVRITIPEGTIQHKNIQCVGHLDNEQMQEEYQSSTLLFPSYIETVGLPILEARQCGTMIVASDTPFSHECLDTYDNALFINPFDENDLVLKMKMVLYSKKELKISNSPLYEKSEWDIILSCINQMKK